MENKSVFVNPGTWSSPRQLTTVYSLAAYSLAAYSLAVYSLAAYSLAAYSLDNKIQLFSRYHEASK